MYLYNSGYEWVKVYSHDAVGGYFPDLESGKQFNEYDPGAYLYSILYKLEDYRKDGIFHIRFCWEELEYDFPCNEWKQSSNFAEEKEIIDFEEVEITFPQSGIGGTFGGLGLSPASYANNLIDDLPDHGNWWYSVGTLTAYGSGFPGPCPYPVTKGEIFIAASMIFIKAKYELIFVSDRLGLQRTSRSVEQL